MEPRLEALAGEVLAAYQAAGVKLVLAEASTGGLVAACLTDLSGASRVVERGFIPYSNEAKEEQLGVPVALMVAHGAVSEPVALALAEGALLHSRADVALAETGVAGPTGGTALKPVGLVHLVVLRRGRAPLAERHVFPGDRQAIRRATAARALELLLAGLGE